MTGLIIGKQIKEFIAAKSNLILLGVLIAVCGIVIPIFSPTYFMMISPMLGLVLIGQTSPEIFVNEKSSRTLETLVTLPVNIKKIIYGKVLSCFLTSLFLYLCSFGLGVLVSLIVRNSLAFTWQQAVESIILASVAFWVFSYQATYFSLKSNDTGSCALTLSFVSFLYSIPAMVAVLFVLEQFDFMTKLWIVSVRFNVLTVSCIYLALGIVVYIILRVMFGHYYDKTKIFGLLRN